jgi:RecA-family ATPase
VAEARTRARTFAEVEEIDQEWLWPGFIPSGLLTVIFGPPKASKTTLVCDYAARISRGDVNPDGTSAGPAATVILAALEDISESSTIKKLRAAKADLANVVDASGGPDGDGLELSLDHVAWLHEVAAEHPGTALIVIDTLSSSATRPTTTRQGLKAMLKPLASLAAARGCAVILTAHSLKGKDDVPEGGQSLVSIPRQVLTIQRSKDEPGVRTLSVYASNVTSDSGEGMRYTLKGTGPDTTVEWAWDTVRHGTGPEATGQARILLLLANSPAPLTPQLIAAKTGIKYPVTRVLLSRMARRGEVISPSRGAYTTPRERRATA